MDSNKSFVQAMQQNSKLNAVLSVCFVVMAVVSVLMNIQVFVWWRKAKHSTCWISFAAITNIFLVSSILKLISLCTDFILPIGLLQVPNNSRILCTSDLLAVPGTPGHDPAGHQPAKPRKRGPQPQAALGAHPPAHPLRRLATMRRRL